MIKINKINNIVAVSTTKPPFIDAKGPKHEGKHFISSYYFIGEKNLKSVQKLKNFYK